MEKFLKKLAGVATEEFVLFTLFSSFVLLLNSFISVFNSVRLYFCFPAKECSSESLSCNIMNHRFSAFSMPRFQILRQHPCALLRRRKLLWDEDFLSFFFESCTKVLLKLNNVWWIMFAHHVNRKYLTICNQYSCTCRSLRTKVSIEISCLTISPLTECKIFWSKFKNSCFRSGNCLRVRKMKEIIAHGRWGFSHKIHFCISFSLPVFNCNHC